MHVEIFLLLLLKCSDDAEAFGDHLALKFGFQDVDVEWSKMIKNATNR